MVGDVKRNAGVLVDTNLLVLLAIGSVNRQRIESFKRTRQYRIADFELLVRVLDQWTPVFTIPHVLAEVSNLTDLPGPERRVARAFLKQTISVMEEIQVASLEAAEDSAYESLGLSDAGIAVGARRSGCVVLTDDLDLYLRLARENLPVINFTHLRARSLGF